MFWAFESELQSNPMPFRLQSLWDVTLMLLIEGVRLTETEQNGEVGKQIRSGFKAFVDQSS